MCVWWIYITICMKKKIQVKNEPKIPWYDLHSFHGSKTFVKAYQICVCFVLVSSSSSSSSSHKILYKMRFWFIIMGKWNTRVKTRRLFMARKEKIFFSFALFLFWLLLMLLYIISTQIVKFLLCSLQQR